MNKRNTIKLGMVVHISELGIWEAEAEGWWVWDQLDLQSKTLSETYKCNSKRHQVFQSSSTIRGHSKKMLTTCSIYLALGYRLLDLWGTVMLAKSLVCGAFILASQAKFSVDSSITWRICSWKARETTSTTQSWRGSRCGPGRPGRPGCVFLSESHGIYFVPCYSEAALRDRQSGWRLSHVSHFRRWCRVVSHTTAPVLNQKQLRDLVHRPCQARWQLALKQWQMGLLLDGGIYSSDAHLYFLTRSRVLISLCVWLSVMDCICPQPGHEGTGWPLLIIFSFVLSLLEMSKWMSRSTWDQSLMQSASVCVISIYIDVYIFYFVCRIIGRMRICNTLITEFAPWRCRRRTRVWNDSSYHLPWLCSSCPYIFSFSK